MSSASLREIGSDVLTHFERVVQMLNSSPTAQGEAVLSFSPYKDDVHLEQERGMNILRHIPSTCRYTCSLCTKTAYWLLSSKQIRYTLIIRELYLWYVSHLNILLTVPLHQVPALGREFRTPWVGRSVSRLPNPGCSFSERIHVHLACWLARWSFGGFVPSPNQIKFYEN